MRLSDSKKDKQLKLKSYRIRCGKYIRDFHGRRQIDETHKSFNLEPEVVKDTIQKPNPFPISLIGGLCRPIFSPQRANSFSLFGPKTEISTDKLLPIQNVEPTKWEPEPTQSFEQHMAKWEEDFHKPFATTSQNCQYEMPYCYTEEYFNRERAKAAVTFDFDNSQLAVPQDYRQRPLQMILIKSSVAQIIADACDLNNVAKLYLSQFINDKFRFEMSGPAFFQEKCEGAIYLVPKDEISKDCRNGQVRTDCAIYTSSWQN